MEINKSGYYMMTLVIFVIIHLNIPRAACGICLRQALASSADTLFTQRYYQTVNNILINCVAHCCLFALVIFIPDTCVWRLFCKYQMACNGKKTGDFDIYD